MHLGHSLLPIQYVVVVAIFSQINIQRGFTTFRSMSVGHLHFYPLTNSTNFFIAIFRYLLLYSSNTSTNTLFNALYKDTSSITNNRSAIIFWCKDPATSIGCGLLVLGVRSFFGYRVNDEGGESSAISVCDTLLCCVAKNGERRRQREASNRRKLPSDFICNSMSGRETNPISHHLKLKSLGFWTQS